MNKFDVTTTINRVNYVTSFTHEGELSAMIKGVLGKGASELLRDAGSTTKGSQAEKHKAITDRNAKLNDGTYVFGGGGGGGARLTAEERGWIEYFNSIQHKEGGKVISGKNLDRAQKTLFRQDLLEEYQAGTEERKDIASNFQRWVDDRFQGWKDAVEGDQDDPVAQMIAIQKANDAIKTNARKPRSAKLAGNKVQ